MTTLAELFGTHPITCGHEMMTGGWIYLVTPSEEEDWAWARANFASGPHITSVRLCGECEGERPSIVARKRAEMERQQARRIKEQEEQRQRWADGADMQCPDCERIFHEEELIELRECPHCEEFFSGTDEGRNCPSCNRPFSRKVLDGACPDCLDETAEPTKIEVMPDI